MKIRKSKQILFAHMPCFCRPNHPSSSTTPYQNYFFSWTTTEWNTLPLNLIETPDPGTFTALIQCYYDLFFLFSFFLSTPAGLTVQYIINKVQSADELAYIHASSQSSL